jgi:hypothetical protein
MANDVFANNMEVSCKAADGKSICAFPDVCFTPPQTPATPPGVPIPYPNTGMAADTTNGSSTVKISKKEVMLKNKSYFKKSTGDEAGCAPKKGVITSSNTGKVYFVMWSMDVKVEGENVVRNLDITTGNHACPLPNEAVPWPYLDEVALNSPEHPCVKAGYVEAVNTNCRDPIASDGSPECCDARRCVLVPERPESNCKACGGKTPHHPIPVAELSEQRQEGQARGTPRYPNYSSSAAPCICVDGTDHDARDPVTTQLMEHGRLGAKFAQLRNAALPKKTKLGTPYKFDIALECGSKAVKETTGCDEDCTRKQLEKGHQDMGIGSEDHAFKSKQKAKVAEFKKPPGPPDADV